MALDNPDFRRRRSLLDALFGEAWDLERRRRQRYLALAVLLCIAGGVAVLWFDGGKSPRPGGRTLGAAAPRQTSGDGAGRLTAILGVLRRAQTAADRDLGPLLTREFVKGGNMFAAGGVPAISGIRLATVTAWGLKEFLMPVKPPTQASIAKLPSPQRILASHWQQTGPMLATFDSDGGGCCVTATEIEDGRAWTYGSQHLNYALLIVPDGIARVSLEHGPGVINATVHGNVAAFEMPRSPRGTRPPSNDDPTTYQMTWYGRSGVIVKRFPPGRPPGVHP